MKSIRDFLPEIQQRLSGFVRYLDSWIQPTRSKERGGVAGRDAEATHGTCKRDIAGVGRKDCAEEDG